MKHELQYNDDGPNHCINCGTFSAWLDDTCDGYKGTYTRRFDFNQPDNWKRQAIAMFGEEAISGS